MVATTTKPDGSANDPATIFPATTTTTLIVVLAVRGLPAATKLSFTRYLAGGFVDTGSALIAKPTNYFYFKFSVQPGKRLAAGAYLLRLYVNETRACTTAYSIA